jgi:hypothetical protein
MNKWDKFLNHLQELNWPAVEKFVPNGGFEEWRLVSYCVEENTFDPDSYYRIAQDKHHDLRLRWLVSNKTLPIEYKTIIDREWNIASPKWDQEVEYREAVGNHEIEEASALSTQVGGSHYKDMKIQPAEYTHANGIGHLAGDAIAYISRYKSKNGRQDLEKAIHSLQLLIQLDYGDE